jgi:hypothetical protein
MMMRSAADRSDAGHTGTRTAGRSGGWKGTSAEGGPSAGEARVRDPGRPPDLRKGRIARTPSRRNPAFRARVRGQPGSARRAGDQIPSVPPVIRRTAMPMIDVTVFVMS